MIGWTENNTNQTDLQIADFFGEAWTNFAKYGKPSLNDTWKASTSTELTTMEYMDINPNSEMKSGYRTLDRVQMNRVLPIFLGTLPPIIPDYNNGSALGCPTGWTKSSINPKRCYNIYSSTTSQNEAQAKCIKFFGSLLSIDNAFENNAVQTYITLNGQNCTKTYIGLVENGSTWSWSNGDTSTYRNWEADAIFIFLLIIAIVQNIDCGESCREVPPERKTSFLWKISSDSLIAESYLFGTVHVNYKDVWDAVSFETKQALFGSNAVFLEISNGDARNLTGEIGCKNLENSQNLQKFLSKADYELVENFMHELYGIIKTNQDEDFVDYLNYTILGNWQNKKPLALFIELEQFFGDMSVPEFSQAFTEIVLDDYIEMLGQHFNKTTGSVENPERECYIYEDPSEETWLLKYLPKHFDLSNVSMVNVSSSSKEVIQDELYNETAKFLNDYKCGIFNLDMDEHDISLKIEDVTKEDQVKLQRLNQKLQNAFYKRNFNMATKIHNLLTQNSSLSHFFALGYETIFGGKLKT
uniref:Metalloprotease TIKI homolog n=1 Tax=Acrobeloides nanus TaxID=290746 RepID=A0A914EHK7_9BILA